MRTNCCNKLLAFNLKFLNFLQFFLGFSTVIYSAYLLNQWQNQAPVVPSPPPSAPPPNYLPSFYNNGGSLEVADQIESVDFAVKLVSGSEIDLDSQLHFIQLPAPWYNFLKTSLKDSMAVASALYPWTNYIFLAILLILLEAAAVVFIAIDQRWDKDLPYDPTGELEKLKFFVKENIDVCKWLGLTFLSVQALSVLLSLVLRAMIHTPREDSDVEDGNAAGRDRIREPLLYSQSNQSSLKGEGKGTFSDIWTTRIRQKAEILK
uniref:Uncharacterized protein n=1 Tax=Chenopodium quinoa TaxID=63459 RepID=A0A803M916_CHEQI